LGIAQNQAYGRVNIPVAIAVGDAINDFHGTNKMAAEVAQII
jgi:hypothetical protein